MFTLRSNNQTTCKRKSPFQRKYPLLYLLKEKAPGPSSAKGRRVLQVDQRADGSRFGDHITRIVKEKEVMSC